MKGGAILHGVYFTYNNQSSQDYNLIIVGFDTPEVPLAMSREIFSGSMNQYRNKTYHMGTNWSGVLSFTVSFMKDPCVGSDLTFSEDEISAINAWLTSPNYPILFHMYDYVTDDNEEVTITGKKYDYFGLFSDVAPNTFSENIIGLTATFQTNSPFAWTQEISRTFNIVAEESETCTITVNNDDRLRQIYPVITVRPTSSPGDGRVNITITNTRDGFPMNLNIPVEPVTIDCEKSIISDAAGVLTFEDLGIGAEDYIYWPKLYHGQNTFQITGDCEITFTYREPRKVGAY